MNKNNLHSGSKEKTELENEFRKLQQDYEIIKKKYEASINRARNEEIGMDNNGIFHEAFVNNPDAININRISDGVYISINDGFKRIVGYTEREVIGRTSLELNIWVDKGDREKLVKGLEKTGKVENMEALFRRKDGSLVYGLLSASVIELDGIPHSLNLTKDITWLKKASETLLREQLLVKALMENLTDRIYFKDRESRFIRINRSLAGKFGLEDSSLIIGKSDFDFFTKEHAQQAFDDEQQIIKTGEMISKEEKETNPGGHDTWVSTVKMPLYDLDGKIIGTYGISRDITEQKRKELESNIIFDITKGVTTTSNLDELIGLIHQSVGKIIYAENFYIALCNRNTGQFSFPYYVDNVEDKPSPDAMKKSCTSYVFRIEKPFLRTRDEYDRLVREGEVEPSENPSSSWIGIPLHTPSTIIGVMVLQHHDKDNVYDTDDMQLLMSIGNQVAVSIERKKTEEEIMLKNELLQVINAEKDKFFSILAHDLRSPLSAFIAATQILIEEIRTMDVEEIKTITKSMNASATNIYSLLENLLEWSRLKRSVIEFKPEVFRLKEKIDASVGVLMESAINKKIKIGLNIDPDIEVNVDNHMFDSVMRNLVSNAIKFTHVGGSIKITAEKDKEMVEIMVQDTGIGMDEELRSRLFMISGGTNRKGTEGELSTGLGLLLCKEFIAKNGGDLNVESETGKGSIFRFTVPGR